MPSRPVYGVKSFSALKGIVLAQFCPHDMHAMWMRSHSLTCMQQQVWTGRVISLHIPPPVFVWDAERLFRLWHEEVRWCSGSTPCHNPRHRVNAGNYILEQSVKTVLLCGSHVRPTCAGCTCVAHDACEGRCTMSTARRGSIIPASNNCADTGQNIIMVRM